MNIIFDMETGDPDDLITLLLLLSNKEVNLKAITCYQGSPIQIGLIQHILNITNQDIPLAGWNTESPKELNPYYTSVIGKWNPLESDITPTELIYNTIKEFPDIHILTGAPLTNIALTLKKYPTLIIQNMTTQGGYLGNLIPEDKRLDKFKNKTQIKTYNLTNDVESFNIVNYSEQIEKLTYVTKDLCHGFVYTPEIHNSISFGNSKAQQLLKRCLEHYSLSDKNKALHDPLAMIYMLMPEHGITTPISMSYATIQEQHLFSSVEGNKDSFTYGLIDYNKDKCWNYFSNICSKNNQLNSKNIKNC